MSLAGPLTRRVLGANDRVRVGVIGTGRQGTSNLKAFQRHGRRDRRGLRRLRAEPRQGQGGGPVGTGRRGGRHPLRLPAAPRRQDDRRRHQRHPRPLARAARRSWPARPARTSSSRSRSRCRSRRARPCWPRPASTSGSSRSPSGSARTPTSSRRSRSSARASSARSRSSGPGTTPTRSPDGIGNPPDSDPPAGLDWDMWLGPAPEGAVQRQPLRGGRPLVHLPPLLGLLERHARRLGRAPDRHRAVGARHRRVPGSSPRPARSSRSRTTPTRPTRCR